MANHKFLVKIKDPRGHLDGVPIKNYSSDELYSFLRIIFDGLKFKIDVQRVENQK